MASGELSNPPLTPTSEAFNFNSMDSNVLLDLDDMGFNTDELDKLLTANAQSPGMDHVAHSLSPPLPLGPPTTLPPTSGPPSYFPNDATNHFMDFQSHPLRTDSPPATNHPDPPSLQSTSAAATPTDPPSTLPFTPSLLDLLQADSPEPEDIKPDLSSLLAAPLQHPTSLPPPAATPSFSHATPSSSNTTSSPALPPYPPHTFHTGSPSTAPPSSAPPPTTALPPSDPKLRLKLSRKKARERKKEMLDTMQQNVQNLMAHVQSLTTENGRLKNRNAILESIVQYLEEFMALKAVKSKQPVPPPSAQAAAAAQLPGGVDPSTQQALLQVAATMPAATVNNLLSLDFKSLTPDKVIAAWKLYIAQASVWVLQAEAQNPPTQEVLNNISALNVEFLAFVKGLGAENVDALQGAQVLNLQSATLPISEDQHWRNVAASLDLTPQQCNHIYVARELFLQAATKYSAERSSLSTMLQDAIQGLSGMSLNGMGPADTAAMMEDRVVSQIKANLKRQSITYLAFSFFVIERIFTPLQFAKMFVHSHPFFASPLTLMNIITGCAEPQSAAANDPTALPPPTAAPSPLTLLSFLSANPAASIPHPGLPKPPQQSHPTSAPYPAPAAALPASNPLPFPLAGGAAALAAPNMGNFNFFPDLPASWADPALPPGLNSSVSSI